MAYDINSVVTLGILKDAMTRLRADYNGAVAQSGHLKFEKTDVTPTVETAQENVLYLTPGSDATHYIAYALIDGAIICVGETSAEMADYVTMEQLTTVVNTTLDTSLDGKIATAAEAREMFDDVLSS